MSFDFTCKRLLFTLPLSFVAGTMLIMEGYYDDDSYDKYNLCYLSYFSLDGQKIMKNVFYFKDINSVGGVESFFYYLSCLYKNMVVYYRTADLEQIKRLAKNIEVRKYRDGEKIKCDRFFCCYSPDIIDNVEAKEYIHLIHCDYKSVKFNPIMHPKFKKYIGVSKLACRSFEELTGIKAELIYNPIVVKKPKVEKYNDGKLHLISITRLTPEKGGERMNQLAMLLEKAGIDFVWDVYSNRRHRWTSSKITKHDTKLDLTEEVAKADFLVQLSSHEAFGLSVGESLCLGTPVIVTDIPAFREIGCRHGENAVICNLGMTSVDIDMIKKGLPKFKYTPPKSDWGKYLDNDSDYNPKDLIKVKARIGYTDIQKGRVRANEVFEVSKERASYLEAYTIGGKQVGLVDRI